MSRDSKGFNTLFPHEGTLKEKAKAVLDFAKEVLEDDGFHAAMVIMVDSPGHELVGAVDVNEFMENGRTKGLLPLTMGATLRKNPQVTEYFFISEGWTLKVGSKDEMDEKLDKHGSVKDCPGRGENLMVAAYSRTDSGLVSVEFEKDAKLDVTFGEESFLGFGEEGSSAEGRLMVNAFKLAEEGA